MTWDEGTVLVERTVRPGEFGGLSLNQVAPFHHHLPPGAWDVSSESRCLLWLLMVHSTLTGRRPGEQPPRWGQKGLVGAG